MKNILQVVILIMLLSGMMFFFISWRAEKEKQQNFQQETTHFYQESLQYRKKVLRDIVFLSREVLQEIHQKYPVITKSNLLLTNHFQKKLEKTFSRIVLQLSNTTFPQHFHNISTTKIISSAN
jgi:hypothetical protein